LCVIESNLDDNNQNRGSLKILQAADLIAIWWREASFGCGTLFHTELVEHCGTFCGTLWNVWNIGKRAKNTKVFL